MIIPSGRVDKALGVHLQRIYKTNATGAVEKAGRRDIVRISEFSALVEHGRTCAAALPQIRAELVEQVRSALRSGAAPPAADVASRMINRAVEGQV